MWSKNRIGPKTEPCGTPESPVIRLKWMPSTSFLDETFQIMSLNMCVMKKNENHALVIMFVFYCLFPLELAIVVMLVRRAFSWIFKAIWAQTQHL